ncbi:NADPH oxidase organizer 1-like [Corythoichthys intestinalis]|uniref:NADPH oxidase organizer 1-like n=1 Tax=Corythoichthys intestinalis TaxID=161448 RepID=UPI0025A55F8B|nr:NADPH oxidase organizer 1-like [Corythoichthys intestinalis]XP_061807341.1 NADPH oxidase organizer 1-like [Nerophis lumbriciformis]
MPAEKRFVFSARIIGAVQRQAPKLKMFMISVLWSDENEVIVYRSFEDFKNFHRQLKKKFPLFNSNNSRVIPKFKGETQANGLQQSKSKRYVQRMKGLESYCNKLLMCDQMVTQSSEVTQFFTPRDHDTEQDFTKNSIMILLSDDNSGGGGSGGISGEGGGSITHPFVTETYRCVAAYETKDTNNRPFKVAMDETLDVLIKEPSGWWLVENEEKHIAWFPATYLEKEENDNSGFQTEGPLYCAVRNYFTKKHDEVSLPIGSVVEVLKMSDDGWWLTRFKGKVGYVPAMYLQPYNNPRTGLFSLKNKLNRSSLNLTISGAPLDASTSSVQHTRETHAGQGSGVQSRARPSGLGNLAKARSMELLSETQNQTAIPVWDEFIHTHVDGHTRSISTSSNAESSFFSVRSMSSPSTVDAFLPSLQESVNVNKRRNQERRNSSASFFSDISSGSSGSFSSRGSDMGTVAPSVPPRPKKEEIMNRCSANTQKAALATKPNLQMRPESRIHTRL